MSLPNYKNAIKFEDTNYEEVGLTKGSIGSIYITGAGFIDREFRGIGVDSKFGWQEMVWASSPNRSQSFAFDNMDQIEIGIVARCEINIHYLDIQDYMDLRKIVARQRHFYVKFFDIDECKWKNREMYCSENEASRLFVLKQSLIGQMDYTIKFVGTNRDLNLSPLSITYNNDDIIQQITATGDIPVDSGKVWGDQININSGSSLVPDGDYHLAYWYTVETVDGTQVMAQKYGPNQSVTIWDSLVLYPRWEATNG